VCDFMEFGDEQVVADACGCWQGPVAKYFIASALTFPNGSGSRFSRSLWQNFHFLPDAHQQGPYAFSGFSTAASKLSAPALPTMAMKSSRVSNMSGMLPPSILIFGVCRFYEPTAWRAAQAPSGAMTGSVYFDRL